MFTILPCILAALVSIFVSELSRLLWRIVRQKQLGVPFTTSVLTHGIPATDATTVFQELLSVTLMIHSHRQQLLNLVYLDSPPNFPELTLLSNALKSQQKALRALEGLLDNINPPPGTTAIIATVTTGEMPGPSSLQKSKPGEQQTTTVHATDTKQDTKC